MKKYLWNWKYVTFICWCILCSVLFITFYNLPRNFLNFSSELYSTDCPKDILTFKDNGMIATQLWSYASVWALAKTNSRWHPYAPKTTLDRFNTIFTSSSIKFDEYDTLSFKCQHRIYSKGGSLDAPGDRVLNFQFVPEMMAELVFALKNELKKEFIFKKKFIIYVNDLIQSGQFYMEQQGLITNTFVVVLVSSRMKYNSNVYEYYMSSMDWFRKKLINPLFIITGFIYFDDNDLFPNKDVVKVINKGYEYILSIIARCNNLIIDEGPVPIFGTLFAHGYVHVYNPGRLARIDSNITNWIVYKAVNNTE